MANAELALRKFVDTINATDGLVRYLDGSVAPRGDRDWLDLADAYLAACIALGCQPVVTDEDVPL